MTAIIPHKNDVLFGKGTAINSHPGNLQFRSIADAQKIKIHQFETESDPRPNLKRMMEFKRQAATDIMAEIRALTPPGRFLMEAKKGTVAAPPAAEASDATAQDKEVHPKILSKVWILVEEDKIMTKILHRFREKDRGETSSAAPGPGRMSQDEVKKKHNQELLQAQLLDDVHGLATSPILSNTRISTPVLLDHLQTRDLQLQAQVHSPSVNGNMTSPVFSREVVNNIDPRLKVQAHFPSANGNVTSPVLSREAVSNIATNLALEQKEEQQEGDNDEWDSFLEKIHDVDQEEETLGTGLHGLSTRTAVKQNGDTAESEGGEWGQLLGKIHDVDGGDGAAKRLHGLSSSKMTDSTSLGGSGTTGTVTTVDTSLSRQSYHQHELETQDIVEAVHQSSYTSNAGDESQQHQEGEHRRRSSLDEQLDSFLLDFSSKHDDHIIDEHDTSSVDHVGGGETLTLRQLIARYNSGTGERTKLNQVSLEYIKNLALPIATKLTDFLLEAEKNTETSPISLESIDACNVMIHIKGFDEVQPSSATVVEDVRLVGCLADNQDVGPATSKLYPLGRILCELFSSEDPHLGEREDVHQEDGAPNSLLSVNSINLNPDGMQQERKRTQRFMKADENDVYSRATVRMAFLGIPYSVCALVLNLLDSRRGDLCGDDAYSSLEDVSFDLHLMMKDPTRYVDDIATNPMPSTLVVPNKMYGRTGELEKIELAYHRHTSGQCCGVVITGTGGIGKSRLAMHVQQLSVKSNLDSFLVAKFHQNQDARPLSTIGKLFNSLCDEFAHDSTPDQLQSVQVALATALGNQASLLMGVVPSLAKLVLPSFFDVESALGMSANAAVTLQFCLGQILRVVSSYSMGHITLVLDDLQWADPLSLLIIKSLISKSEGNSSIFFTLCHRESDDSEFSNWRNSLSNFSLEEIEVRNMAVDGVNNLVSDTLHMSPRLTRPLSSVLHHKTKGNPLYLVQLLNSLRNQNLISVNLANPCWAWDLEKISDLELSETVIKLFIEEMQKLDDQLRFGLTLAACLGSKLNRDILDILSKDLDVDLQDILTQVSEEGYLERLGDSFCFSHDKIEEAAYHMMSEDQKCKNHLRFGLAICAVYLDSGEEDDVMFFTAIQQINKGKTELRDPNQRSMVASLNLKASRRAAALSDYGTALVMIEHGIEYLENDHWTTQYSLTKDLFDAGAEAACLTNKSDKVTFFTNQVFAKARNEDKLNCMYAVTTILSYAGINEEALNLSFSILQGMGEPALKPIGDAQLTADMQAMTRVILQTSNDSILKMGEAKDSNNVALMKVYVHLITMLHFSKQALIPATNLRLMQLTFRHGLNQTSPMAFVHYAETLSFTPYVDLAVRLAKVALDLLEKKEVTSRYKSSVLSVCHHIVWRNTPFQSIIDLHELGTKVGMQNGDPASSILNCSLGISARTVSGQSLNDVRRRLRELFLQCFQQNVRFSSDYIALGHVHVCSLIEGPSALDAEEIDNVPGQKSIIARAKQNGGVASPILLVNLTYHLSRIVLFRKYDNVPSIVSVSDIIFGKKIPLRLTMLFALFIEGLLVFQLARQSDGEEAMKHIGKGKFILEKMQGWANHCSHNFKNKCELLEAEYMSVTGEYEKAESLYLSSIKSAIQHKFKHEEAIAAELTGLFLHSRGLHESAYAFLVHAATCFNLWGAKAVAYRVEKSIQAMYGVNFTPLQEEDGLLASVLSCNGGSSKKRQEIG